MQNTLFSDMTAQDKAKLTMLSFGAGTDSSAILEMLIEDKDGFRSKYAPNDLIVVMSDTGDEFPQTYEHVKVCERKCQKAGIPFFFLTPDLGYHSESWKSLRHFFRSKGTIMAKAYNKSCTSNLKIVPIYRFLEEYVSNTYNVTKGRKAGFYQFASLYGKIDVILGIAKGEERRVADISKNPNKWYRDCINPVYPLIDLGMDRKLCQDYLATKGLKVLPSNCMACPFMSEAELEYLRRFESESLEELIGLEAAKLKRFSHLNAVEVLDGDGNPIRNKNGTPKTVNKNYGVWGVKTLPMKIEEVKEKFEDVSDDYIIDYRYSHGHCVTASY